MKEIIKEGKKPIKKRHVYIMNCPVCGCIFKCEDNDLEPVGNGQSCAVQCPCCDEYIKSRRDIIKMETECVFEK